MNMQHLQMSLLAKFAIFLSTLIASNHIGAEQLLNFEVQQNGVYQVTHEQLVDAGLDLSGEPIRNIALLNLGESVPIHLTGSSNDATVFGAGAVIHFIGDELTTLYTNTNIYTLSLQAAQQRLIQPESISIPTRLSYASSYLATKSYAPQNEYTFASPDPQEPWYANRVTALQQSAREVINLDLPDYVPGGNTGFTKASMEMKLWGATSLPGAIPDHHVKVEFNGEALIDETFDGFTKQEFSTEVSNLVVGQNSVAINLPLDHGYDYEAVNLDSITVKYPRAFVAENDQLTFKSTFKKFLLRGFNRADIQVYRRSVGNTTLLTQTQIATSCEQGGGECAIRFGGGNELVSEYYAVTGASVLTPVIDFLPVTEDITSGSAEYLIITHPDFLAESHETDHLAALSNDLANQFSSVDVVDVDQIYAQFGDHIFGPQAIADYIKFSATNRGTQTVLLVGGDIYDYHDYQNTGAQSFIPSIYVSTGELMNFAPVDAKYVDLNDENLPLLAIGRLPVRTMSELGTLVDKRTAYLNRTYSQRAVFSADKFDDLREYSFKLDALSLQQQYFGDWDISTAFLDDDVPATARGKIVAAINDGVSLTSFFGHSSTSQWSFSGLFNGFDAANLSNAGRPTIVTQWGCWNTYYVNPREDSMGHRFMMEGAQGAVGVLGATTLTSARNEQQLATKFYKYIQQGESLGEAMKNAKAEFAATDPNALDVILGWTLLGFPELTL